MELVDDSFFYSDSAYETVNGLTACDEINNYWTVSKICMFVITNVSIKSRT